ncbi:Atxe2 family lasso peptide isopeptidase [Sphingobium fuliginis]|jgi:dipeptidyl aminopeptidase/acylaminoacyl peptidase|uniref:Atxe2 family lasso peptide isopeptidase n=2 Tax=Sphingobium fuliginis (strain ATCC 27551) TaxID=336203 RepID=A0A7M2GE85_SPHSA|nr:Atxe2 family lasso peptide isopeptidase [Sphingobium fuliginis]QOT70715.1 Atxe2 family lasso peptide isopeptidase [Sphingobium fuliginis]
MVSVMDRRSIALLAAGVGLLALPSTATADCSDLLPVPAPMMKRRAITAQDLLGVRDIGRGDGALLGNKSPLGLSPDGRQLAFILIRAEASTNSYCIGLAVMDVKPSAKPRLLDQGGEFIGGTGDYRGVILPTGFPILLAPSWSPDGRWIAFLRRDNGVTQLWTVRADGGPARAVTHSPVDVEQFAWGPDGRSLIYAIRTGQMAERTALVREAVTGFRYDDRYVPMMGDKPMPLATTALSLFRVDPGGGEARPGEEGDRALLGPDPIGYAILPLSARADDGRFIQTEHVTANPASPWALAMSSAAGVKIPCPGGACSGKFAGLWWMSHDGPLLFLRREGWNDRSTALYRWRPGSGPPRRIFVTSDVISGCDLAGRDLVCLRQGASVPPRIVRIDPGDGHMDLLYDPNPEYRSIRFGRVERLEWRNDRGLEVAGDLVLPPDYDGQERLPMIVTTYRSNGFLRGATGNEYPIHLFAAKGFAVLSLDRPPHVGAINPLNKDWQKLLAENDRDWGERRSMQSSVMTGVQRVIDMGIADPDRIGITGLSDGSSTVGFALINSRRFAAAAISTCCLEPWTVNATIGPAFARKMRSQGFPPATSDDRDYWEPGSMIRNAASIDTPLLMQLADREYLTAIDVFAALREQGKPVDMYVFPDEFHNKWQPRHRLAIYERNVDWFLYWLQGKKDPDPRKAEQYAIWDRLRLKQPFPP